MAIVLGKNERDPDLKPKITWSNITNADTVNSMYWQGGSGNIEVTGTFDGATVRTKFNKEDSNHYEMKDAEAPDGGTFTTSNITGILNLSAGYLHFTILGGGGSQDITIKAIKTEEGYGR